MRSLHPHPVCIGTCTRIGENMHDQSNPSDMYAWVPGSRRACAYMGGASVELAASLSRFPQTCAVHRHRGHFATMALQPPLDGLCVDWECECAFTQGCTFFRCAHHCGCAAHNHWWTPERARARRVDVATTCSAPHCREAAAAGCSNRACGTHCWCDQHGRRTTRPGPVRGRRAAHTAALLHVTNQRYPPALIGITDRMRVHHKDFLAKNSLHNQHTLRLKIMGAAFIRAGVRSPLWTAESLEMSLAQKYEAAWAYILGEHDYDTLVRHLDEHCGPVSVAETARTLLDQISALGETSTDADMSDSDGTSRVPSGVVRYWVRRSAAAPPMVTRAPDAPAASQPSAAVTGSPASAPPAPLPPHARNTIAESSIVPIAHNTPLPLQAGATAALAVSARPMAHQDALLLGKINVFNRGGHDFDPRALAWPPTVQCPPGMEPPAVGGHFLYNQYSQKPAPHIRGPTSEGNIGFNRGKRARWELLLYVQLGGVVIPGGEHPTCTTQNMLALLHARPGLRRAIVGVRYWEATGTCCRALNDSGFWIELMLCDQRPMARPPAAATWTGVKDGYHGTSLQNLHRIIHEGLRVGMAENRPGGKSIKGIFSWPGLAVSNVAGYAHYANIDNSGWVWAPVIKLAIPDTDPDQRKSTLKYQQISYEDTTTIVSVLLHAVPIHSITFGDGQGPWPYWMTVQARYDPKHELKPEDDWKKILENSVPH